MSSPRRNRHSITRPPLIPFDDDDEADFEDGDIFSLAGRKRSRISADNAHDMPPSRTPRITPPRAQVAEVIDLTTDGKPDQPIDLDAEASEDEASDDDVQIIYDRPRPPRSEPAHSHWNPPAFALEQNLYTPLRTRAHPRAQPSPRVAVNRQAVPPFPGRHEGRGRAPDFLIPELSDIFFPTQAYFAPAHHHHHHTSPRGSFRPPWSQWSRFLADYRMEEPSYEFLSSLDRNNVKKNCASTREISALPVRKITVADVKEDKCCAICLCDFEVGERVKTLPCSHYFHVKCIGEWLRVNKICPVDRKDIITGASD